MHTEKIQTALDRCLRCEANFVEHLQHLVPAEVVRYEVNLVTPRVTYYDAEGHSLILGLPLDNDPPVGDVFDFAGVKLAILNAQQGLTPYPEFLAAIAHAGVASYIVDIQARQVIYQSMGDEAHIEAFPPQLVIAPQNE